MTAEISNKKLVFAGVLLAASNLMVVLDMTIANVSVPHIAGGLAVSGNEGTYVITSYAVAEAISVPLTGWLASRFGSLRVFCYAIFLFGIFSAMCGLAMNLGFLVASRVLQGLAGGPIMPLAQTLLMLIFPKEKQMKAMAIWSMTTLVAPILGPILGGLICDAWGWPWIFLINVPLAIICSIAAYGILKPFETPLQKIKIDVVGLLLLIIFVGSLQFMLDEGQKLDWFASNEIITLAATALLGFIAFLMWELTEKNPIVDLQVFRYRGYTISVITISLTFGAFFGSIVLTPLWLQTNMDYTATWAGFVMAMNGVFALMAAPVAAMMTSKFDLRKLVSIGILWIASVTFMRSFNNSDMTFTQIALPLLFQGIALPFFFIPLSGLALSSVSPQQIASAAGLMNFLRTLAGAFATSLVTTAWNTEATIYRTDIVGSMQPHPEISIPLLNKMVESQSVVLATNHIFMRLTVIFVIAAIVVWFAPKPSQIANPLEAAH